MARTHGMLSSSLIDEKGNLRPEWRSYFQRLGSTLTAAAAVAPLDGLTTYTADQLRDKIIEIQNALGAGD